MFLKTPPLLIDPAVGKENTLAAAFAQYDALHSVAIGRYLASFARGNKVNRTTNYLPESERENFNQAVFALAFFFRRQDRELPGAISRGLLDCPCRG